jgi:ADP-ribose pyrophosphatase
MTRDYEILSRERLFKNWLALDGVTLRHRLHSGGMSQPIRRDLLVRGPAVAVLLYDPDRDEVALIEQFRVGALAAGMSPWVIETVAGLIDADETPRAVALRECEEEAGVRPDALVRICRQLASPGCTDETVEIFVGRVDTSGLGGIHGLPEEGEDIRVLVMPRADAIAACADGRIANAITLVALQWLELNRATLASRWEQA